MEARRTRRTRGSVPDGVSAEARLTVTTTALGEEKQTQDTIQVSRFMTEPAYVRASAGVTRNMGNYQSLRVDVSLTVPCYVEEIDAMFPMVADRVAALLDSEVKNYEQSEGGK